MSESTAIAHPNIALVKYWGKRDRTLNLPAAGSFSLTLGPVRTRTTVAWGQPSDAIRINGSDASPKDVLRLSAFLDRFRKMRPGLGGARVDTENDFPTAAGLASSSSGFAALTLAAARAAELDMGAARLSELSRLGSGSAARSVFGGFARMNAGTAADGTDAVAEQLFDRAHWPDLRVVIAVTTEASKKVSSTDGMLHTEHTSPFYGAWIGTVEPAIEKAVAAVAARDFTRLADIAEASAMQMHASAMASVPAVIYWRGATLDVIRAVRDWRAEGVAAFFTVDAGPHVKVFTTASDQDAVIERVLQIPGVVRHIVAEPAVGAYCESTPRA